MGIGPWFLINGGLECFAFSYREHSHLTEQYEEKLPRNYQGTMYVSFMSSSEILVLNLQIYLKYT